MRIVTKGTLREFAKAHPSQAGALRSWETIVKQKATDWKSWPDVRKTYRTADRVVLPNGNETTIFDVGDGYRLLTFIKYLPAPNQSIVYTKEFLTHAEYDSEAWRTRLDHD
jgi:mRNA-degrading endonuclease HigB of HigAB toxin-antitoxin module